MKPGSQKLIASSKVKLTRRKRVVIATLAAAILSAVAIPAIATAQQASIQPAANPVLSKSAGQIVSLVNATSPMMADMVATKTSDAITLDLKFRSGVKPLNPEIFFKVASLTCANGTSVSHGDYAYGQWNVSNPKILTSNLPAGCDVVGFKLTGFTPAESGMAANSYWTPNQDVVVTLQ